MNNIRFLIVDDFEFSKIFFENAIHYSNYQYVYVNNGKKAIEELKNNNFDIILMDIEMPEMTGIEATNIIRNEFDEPKKSIPIIAITGHTDEEFLYDLKNLGFNGFISKMFTPESISKIIKKYVKKRQKSYSLNFKKDSPNIDEKLEKELVDFFIENTPKTIEILFDALKNKDWKNIKEYCHKLSNQLNYFGLEYAAQTAEYLVKTDYRENTTSDLFDMICEIEKDCILAIIDLKKDYML
jgi:CheY-like chemotaxis protein